ncbi:hypothetical protein RGQ13_03695 [Thalassotalea psychrophila]|uniref:Lipoprotein n=1 Tax=Thalassotalea psychrophila TaxID=3065647 RepID=A0ABY9TZ67_9GAMM|nr:hypothetical protein RGQ13_03695 [Colwelliaceae bacterium SQ149]
MKKFIIVLLSLLTVACGGGGGGSNKESNPTPTPTPPAAKMPSGLWEGEVTYTGERPIAALGIISSTGEARFILETGEQDKYQISLNDENYTADGTAFDVFGNFYGEGYIQGGHSDSEIQGKAYFDNVNTSSFEFFKSESSNDVTTLSDLSGNFTTLDYNSSIAIDSEGFISGSDANGCQYNGEITHPDNTLNVYVINFTISSCGNRYDGKFNGLATYVQIDYDVPQKGLIYQADNGYFSFTNIMIK